MRRTILIIHPGAMGDVLLSVPAIRAVRKSWPDHRLALLAEGEVSRLLLACGEIHAVFPLETQALSELFAGVEVIRPDLRGWLERCDLAICWMTDPEHRLRATLDQAGICRIIMQSALSSACRAEHQEDRLLEIVNGVAFSMHDSNTLALPSQVIAEGKSTLTAIGVVGCTSSLVVFHPGSGSRHKCGDPILFAEAIAWCRQKALTPILIGGPADDAMVRDVADLCRIRPMILQREPLLSMAGVLAHASLFVGYDSGLTHLAARLDRPVVALFGPTDPRRWSPRGARVMTVRGEACQCEGWAAVKACGEKPCLRVSIQNLIGACERTLSLRSVALLDRLVMSSDLC